ncbi:MAG: isopeptide-forming domain-containing fimbrial protein, partial [Parvularculaceae bacterium]
MSATRRGLLSMLAGIFATGTLARANDCATPAAQGSATISGVVNTYFPATSSLSAGGTLLTLGAATGAATPIAAGDLVLIIQMQDADFDRDNDDTYGDGAGGSPDSGATGLRRSGQFAFARATSAVTVLGGVLTIAASTGIDFTNAAASAIAGQRRFQVIRVPQYDDATIAGTVTAPAWNGASGGVVVLDVASQLTFSAGIVSVDGLGFRGGGGRQLGGALGLFANTDRRTAASSNLNAAKGEGVAGTPRYVLNASALLDTGVEGYPNGSNARGAPGNAGGGGTDGDPLNNDENTGGGGGAGHGGGGRGGHAWCPTAPTGCAQTGGWGGAGVASQGAALVLMGGGGGAGTTNDGTGTPGAGLASSGAAGGGIII